VKVLDFCTRDVATVAPLASLREAAILMRNRHVGTLVVVDATPDGARPAGIITDRDIVVAAIAVPGARPEGIRVQDAMSTRLVCVRDTDGVFEAARAMGDSGVRRLLVVNAKGMLQGIVSANDVQRIVATEMASLGAALRKGVEQENSRRHVLDVLLRD
jgi:CBS domain-containing protein